MRKNPPISDEIVQTRLERWGGNPCRCRSNRRSIVKDIATDPPWQLHRHVVDKGRYCRFVRIEPSVAAVIVLRLGDRETTRRSVLPIARLVCCPECLGDVFGLARHENDFG